MAERAPTPNVASMWSILLLAALLGFEPQANTAPLFHPPPFPGSPGTQFGFRAAGPVGYRKLPRFPSFHSFRPSFNNFVTRRPFISARPMLGYAGAFNRPRGYMSGFVNRRQLPAPVGWNRYGMQPVTRGFRRNNHVAYRVAATNSQAPVIQKKIEMGRHVSPFENGNILSKVNPYPNNAFRPLNRLPMGGARMHTVAKAKQFNSLIQ